MPDLTISKTWGEWLAVAKVTDNPCGDFVSDARRDLTMPKNIGSYHQLCFHLHMKQACPEAMEASREAWQRYRKWRKR